MLIIYFLALTEQWVVSCSFKNKKQTKKKHQELYYRLYDFCYMDSIVSNYIAGAAFTIARPYVMV